MYNIKFILINCSILSLCIRMQLLLNILNFCVTCLRSSETSVHNFLVSSYANSNDPSDHQKLQDYLVKQAMVSETTGNDWKWMCITCITCTYINSILYIIGWSKS